MTARRSLGSLLLYWGCAVILITYMSVTLVDRYKIWYFPTVLLSIAALILLVTKQIYAAGLFRSMSLLVLYYGSLLLTALWADRPEETIWWVSVETVFIGIAALFYLLSLNFHFETIIAFFVNLIPIASIIYVATYLFDPEVSRLGGYVLNLAPFCLIFCGLRLRRRWSLRDAIYAFACILMLILSMSRTPLLGGGFGLLLLFAATSEGVRDRVRLAAICAFVGLLVYASILTIPQVRLFAGKSFARITGKDLSVGGEFIAGEDRDEGRWNIYEDAKELYKEHWLHGIGYMNFQQWYGERYGIFSETTTGKRVVGMNLHNVFQTWGLEGGVPCLLIVSAMLFRYFRILWKAIRHSASNEERSYYKTLVITMICLLIEGLFHQIHEAPVFYMLLGITYALPYKRPQAVRAARREVRLVSSNQPPSQPWLRRRYS